MKKRSPVFSDYESLLITDVTMPNFWVAEEYWRAAGWKLKDSQGVLAPYDGRTRMLPTLPGTLLGCDCWAGWPGLWGFNGDFLDWQFLYDPASFHDLSGHDRAVFRKNTRHFERLHADIVYRPLRDDDNPTALLAEWVTEGQEVYDLDTIIRYLEQLTPDRAAILEVGGTPVGLNCWDENYLFVNFRYSFAGKIPYLSEYIRLRFYLDMADRTKKLVNDGGSLGNDNLYRFKMKLRPHGVLPVYSWKPLGKDQK